MRTVRCPRPTRALPILLAAGVLLHVAGCGNGGGGDKSIVQIGPEATQKNKDMLEKMHNDAISKYKKPAGKR